MKDIYLLLKTTQIMILVSQRTTKINHLNRMINTNIW
jgi:hypothetical protein